MTVQPKLLLADVDGTLLTPEKQLTDEAIAAVQALGRAGIGFAVTSGRPPQGLRMLIEPLALTTPLAGFNGGAFVRPDLSVIERQPLPAKAAAETVRLLRAAGVAVWLYTADSWLVTDAAAPHARREAQTVGYAPDEVVDFPAGAYDSAIKVVGVSDDFPRLQACTRQLQQVLDGQVSAQRSQSYYLDVTHPQANKGAVVGRMAALLQVQPGEIATIGDMPNDMLMFAKSGLSIAMGNAEPAVKAAADHVTASNSAEGFAKAVEWLLARGSHD